MQLNTAKPELETATIMDHFVNQILNLQGGGRMSIAVTVLPESAAGELWVALIMVPPAPPSKKSSSAKTAKETTYFAETRTVIAATKECTLNKSHATIQIQTQSANIAIASPPTNGVQNNQFALLSTCSL